MSRDLDGLIAELEGASEGGRHLDARIYEALGFEISGARSWRDSRRGVAWRYLHDNRWRSMRHYTTSLDAAVTLVPNTWGWKLTSSLAEDAEPWHEAKIWEAGSRDDDMRSEKALAGSPALALCIVALRALRAPQSPVEPGEGE